MWRLCGARSCLDLAEAALACSYCNRATSMVEFPWICTVLRQDRIKSALPSRNSFRSTKPLLHTRNMVAPLQVLFPLMLILSRFADAQDGLRVRAMMNVNPRDIGGLDVRAVCSSVGCTSGYSCCPNDPGVCCPSGTICYSDGTCGVPCTAADTECSFGGCCPPGQVCDSASLGCIISSSNGSGSGGSGGSSGGNSGTSKSISRWN
jgi:hypothetical protein